MNPVTAPTLGRPVGASGEETRRRIVNAAIRCVAEGGYSQATIREIARAADVTSASLYNYFPTKRELFKATVSSVEDLTLPRLQEAATHGATVVDRIDAVLDESDRLMREYPYLADFERAVRTEHAARAHRDDPDARGLHALRAIIGDIVEDAQRSGALADGTNAQAVVDVLYALARGLTDQAAGGASPDRRQTLDTAKRLIHGTLIRTPRASRKDRR